MERKTKILVVLLGCLTVTASYRLLYPYEPERVEQLTYSRQGAGQHQAARQSSPEGEPADAPSLVMLELLAKAPAPSGQIGRNLFFAARPPAEPAPPALPDEAPQGYLSDAEAPAPPPPSPAPWEVLQQDLARFRFFGFYEQGDRLHLFLRLGKQILAVGPGDLLAGKYRISAVDRQSLTLTAEAFSDPVRIDLEQLFADRSLAVTP